MSHLAELTALFSDYGINLNDELLEQYYHTWIYLNTHTNFYNFCEVILSLLEY